MTASAPVAMSVASARHLTGLQLAASYGATTFRLRYGTFGSQASDCTLLCRDSLPTHTRRTTHLPQLLLALAVPLGQHGLQGQVDERHRGLAADDTRRGGLAYSVVYGVGPREKHSVRLKLVGW